MRKRYTYPSQTKKQAALSRQANGILGCKTSWFPKRKRRRKTNKRRVNVAPFFYTQEWKEIRYQVLKRDDGRCQLCGRSQRDGVIMNVDHIKPRLKYPHLALDIKNLQTLCSSCNLGKGWRDETSWLLDQEYNAIMTEDSPVMQEES